MNGILTKGAFLTYTALQARLEDDGFIYIIQKELERIGFKETTIRKHINQLKYEGWIEDHTISGYSNKFKPLKFIKCPDFIYNKNFTTDEKIFLLDILKAKSETFTLKGLEKSLKRDKLEKIIKPFEEKHGSIEKIIKNTKAIKINLPEKYNKYEKGYQIKQINFEKEYKCQYCGETDPIKFNKNSTITCVQCLVKRSNENKRNNFAKYILKLSKAGSKNRGRIIEHNLTEEDIQKQIDKQNSKCYYTGIEFSLENYPSIDRIDSNGIYEPSNIVICLQDINKMKMDFSVETFKYYIEKLYLNLKNF